MPLAYSVLELIQLPSMDAHTLDGFGRRLGAQFEARKKQLKKTQLPALALALSRAVDDLGAALALEQSRGSDGVAAAKLDPAVDATWASLVTLLETAARLAWTDAGARAQEILDAVFPKRLEFTQKDYVTQWSEANTRIAKLLARQKGGPSYADTVRAYGTLGKLVFDEVREKHAAFADALGISTATDAPESADVRTPYDAVLTAAKEYIAAVINLTAREVKEPDEMKTFLLHVIEEFSEKSRARRASKKSADGEAKKGDDDAKEPEKKSPEKK